MTILSKICSACCTVGAPVKKKLLNPAPVVSVLHLHGVIGQTGKLQSSGMTYDSLQEIITDACKHKRSRALVLRVNSPGGSPVQSALIANMIREQAAKHDLPIYAFIEDIGASGGYWLACAADEIYAMDASIVGSIGVIAAGFGFTEFIQKHGVERRVYSQGKNKAMLDPFLPEKNEDIKQLTDAQKDVHEGFIQWVKDRRGEKLSGKDSELFTGAIWSGKAAQERGLIDGLDSFRHFCQQRFGDEVEFKEFKNEKGFFARKFGLFSPAIWVDALAEAVAQRTHWARFGL